MKVTVFFILIFSKLVFSQTEYNDLHNIKKSQIIDIKLKKDSSFIEAYNTLSKFLFYRDKNLVVYDNSLDSNYIDIVFENLFVYNTFLNKYLSFYVYQAKGNIQNGYMINVLLSHDYSLYPKEQQGYTLYYIYEAKLVFINGEFKIDISPRVKHSVCKKNITYHYVSKKNISQKKIRLAKEFLKKLENKFQYVQNKELNYYVVNKDQDVMSIIGLQYNLLSTSFFSKKISSIYTNKYGEFNKHELTHYFFQDYNLGKFLSEGLAVYYNIDNENIEEKLISIKSSISYLTSEEKNNWINDFLKGKFGGGVYQVMFYTLSGLIVEDYLKEKDEIALKDIIVRYPNITPKEFITKYLVINSDIENYLWSKIQ